MIISHFPSGSSGGNLIPEFTYTGSYDLVSEAEGWKIRFLTSGTFTPKSNVTVDIFCVGGGGNGNNYGHQYYPDSDKVAYDYGGAGGGGYTNTSRNRVLIANTGYAVIVGGADNASSFGSYCSANGGQSGGQTSGGNGGSGGGGKGTYTVYRNGNYYSGSKSKAGGTNGGNGTNGGTGQNTTTREFGESSGALYASGGTAYGKWNVPSAPAANTGNGGNGTSTGSTSGASGIVIIRNARA